MTKEAEKFLRYLVENASKGRCEISYEEAVSELKIDLETYRRITRELSLCNVYESRNFMNKDGMQPTYILVLPFAEEMVRQLNLKVEQEANEDGWLKVYGKKFGWWIIASIGAIIIALILHVLGLS